MITSEILETVKICMNALLFFTFIFLSVACFIQHRQIKDYKLQSKTDSSIIAKNINRIIKQGIDIETLKDQKGKLRLTISELNYRNEQLTKELEHYKNKAK